MSTLASWLFLMFAFLMVILPAMILMKRENNRYKRNANQKMSDEWLWHVENGRLK